MCKVSGVVGITDKNRSDIWVFMELLGQMMSPGNNSGLGYAAIGKDGKIFGEKWIINESAFKDLTKVPGITSEKMSKVYGFFGDKVDRDSAEAIILHTRAATQGSIAVKNTHPFIDDETNPSVAIIHNGWVHNFKDFTRKYSECDSEVLAHLYAENNVKEDLGNINKFTSGIDGWFTVLSLGTDNEGKMIMDAYTDNGRLGSYFIKELDTRIYSSDGDDVQRIAKALGLTPINYQKMTAYTGFRINVKTGEQISHVKLTEMAPVPARVIQQAFWDEWDRPNIVTMDGNLDDQKFLNKYFPWVNYRKD